MQLVVPDPDLSVRYHTHHIESAPRLRLRAMEATLAVSRCIWVGGRTDALAYQAQASFVENATLV